MEAKGYFLLQQWLHDNYKSFGMGMHKYFCSKNGHK